MRANVELCIYPDSEFPVPLPYSCYGIRLYETGWGNYNIRLYGRNATTNSQKLKHIEIQFILTQKSNYSKDDVQKTIELINQYFSHKHNIDWGHEFYTDYAYCSNFHAFIREIRYRLNTVQRDRLLETRSITSILGNFEESISPKMIHKILTWLKKKDFPKYGTIKRGIKEQIIIDLKNHDIFINPKILCDFIDDNNPIEFVKEWKIKTHINGKKMKNIEIRKLFKKAFYKRDNDCIRFKMICPSLNSLPKHIEGLIISYLGFSVSEQSV